MWFVSMLMAASSNLPNNTSLSYPLRQVSTLECRTLYWNDMPDSCKINLPIIHWANYSTYQSNELYRSIYTTLWAAPYSDSWNQKEWAHWGVDIATARGTPLYSIWDGEVYSAWRNSAYGNLVRIKYVYNWEIIYWVYAHMDSIDVKVWDKVSIWQKIWTVWNSGNTFWWLWWYHVHFEIDKDNFGRPAYAYTNCPDLSKWHYKIIQNWLCRSELISYQYDPIRILESNSTYVFITEDNTIKDNDTDNKDNVIDTENNTWDNTWVNRDIFVEIKNNTWNNIDIWIKDNDIYQDMKNVVDSNDSEIDKRNDLINKQNDTHSSSNNEVDIKDDLLSELDQDNVVPTLDIETSSTEYKSDPLIIDLDFSGLKYLAEHFIRLWDIEMKSELKERSLMLWETATIDIEIFKKWKNKDRDWNYYNWVLQLPLIFLSNNDIVQTDINSLQLITKWKAKIELTWNKVWKSTIIIKLDDKKIWYLNIFVK